MAENNWGRRATNNTTTMSLRTRRARVCEGMLQVMEILVSNHLWSRGPWRGTCLAYRRVDSVASQEGRSEPCARKFLSCWWSVFSSCSRLSQNWNVVKLLLPVITLRNWYNVVVQYSNYIHLSSFIAFIIIHACSKHLGFKRERWATCYAEDIPVPILGSQGWVVQSMVLGNWTWTLKQFKTKYYILIINDPHAKNICTWSRKRAPLSSAEVLVYQFSLFWFYISKGRWKWGLGSILLERIDS